MISAQNRRLLLSGSNLLSITLGILLILGSGCATTKSGQRHPVTKTDPSVSSNKTKVYNPSTGTYEPVDDPMKLVDTIQFQEDMTPTPEVADTRNTGKKDQYDIAFLFPFNADKNQLFNGTTDPKVRRFIHYYAGVTMALKDLNELGMHISAEIYDTRESADVAKQCIGKLKNIDAVVGPYESDGLREAAAFSTRTKIPVFSPWTPSIPLETDNPWFVQLTPGLEAHAQAIVSYVDSEFPSANVYLVARDDPKEKSRLNIFRDAHASTQPASPYEELIVDTTSLLPENTMFEPLLAGKDTTVFILPYYSRNDEFFVNMFLRKLHAEIHTGMVYVFGMPQWLAFSKLNPDYLESSHVHITTASFLDPHDPEVHEFQRRFLEEYATLPEPAAYQGFTFVRFLGEALHDYGDGFLDILSDRLQTVEATDFDFVPVYRNAIQEQQNIPNYLENRAIQILEFSDQEFHRVK